MELRGQSSVRTRDLIKEFSFGIVGSFVFLVVKVCLCVCKLIFSMTQSVC